MTTCNHHNIVLLAATKHKVRCRRCHLTIDPEELGDNPCPECYEVHGIKQFDFETVKDGKAGMVRYRCEDCGIFIDA